MFEKYLAQVVIAQMLEQSHPIFQPEHCINRKQKRSICTTCSEICPHHIYTYGKIMKPDWSLCSNCNLCVSACPSRALMSSSLNAQRFLDMLNDNSTVIQIGCPYYTFETPFTVECLGALPWELLASIALRKKLMLLKGDCNQCENKAGCQLFQKNIYRLQVFLQDDYFNQQVQITTDQIAVEEYIFKKRIADNG